MPTCPAPKRAQRVARIRQQEGQAPTTVNHHCTSSIGVVLLTNNEAGPEDILKCADMAMYKAKRDGRNLIRFYE